MLIDAHAHFQDCSPPPNGEEATVPEGDYRFFCNGTKPDDWVAVETVAARDARAVPFYGVHPWFVDTLSLDWIVQLRDKLVHSVSGVGEIGLDRTARGGNGERQKDVFAAQLALAGELARPCIIHCVRAWDDMATLLASPSFPAVPFIMHSFSGSVEDAHQVLDRGGYCSFSLRIEQLKNARDIVATVPLERMLIETDYPYVVKPYDSDSYEAYLKRTYRTVAEMKKVDSATLEHAVWHNSQKIIRVRP